MRPPNWRGTICLLTAALLLAGCDKAPAPAVDETPAARASAAALEYPQSRRDDTRDEQFGVSVADPYRWLEELGDATTKGWVESQNALAIPYLAAIPEREDIVKRMTELWDYPRYGLPKKYGERYFFSVNPGTLNQDLIHVSRELDGESRVLIDPNGFSDDATIALAGFQPSPDGKLVAYNVSDGGSDWDTWRVRDVDSGADLGEVLRYTKFTGASWSRDSSGFYYSRYPQNQSGEGDDHKSVSVYFHRVGTEQAEDELIYALPDEPAHNPYAEVSEDGRYLVIGVYEGFSSNAIHVRELGAPNTTAQRLLDDWDALYEYLGNDAGTLYFKTTKGAPNWRVVAIDVARPGPEHWRDVVAERAEAMDDASFVGGHFVVSYLKDARSQVQVFDPQGKGVRNVELPGIGTATGFNGHADDAETFFRFSSYTSPQSLYRYDVGSGEATLFKRAAVDFDGDAYEVKQVFYSSKDGTRVPMFVMHAQGVDLDGDRPTLLYGYGGFNSAQTPGYSTARAVWLEMGGVLAIANLRGGGEYGQVWHEAGTKLKKQNVFDDFIAAAEWLIANDYTRPAKLAIRGRSNGGLLVGATLTQRPELFGAALPAVGVLDMLRYHLPSANARAWSSDYGLAENEDEFHALHAYSPLHNLDPGTCYPPTLITTADRDDRVVPWHSFKFAAALQHAQGCDNPTIIRVETRAGHGAGKPRWMLIDDYADQWAFLAKALDMKIKL